MHYSLAQPPPPAWADEVQLTAETITWTANNTYVASEDVTINGPVTTKGAGVVLLLLGVDMMFIRVVGGVHYPQDVLAGAACGVLAGVLGFYLIP